MKKPQILIFLLSLILILVKSLETISELDQIVKDKELNMNFSTNKFVAFDIISLPNSQFALLYKKIENDIRNAYIQFIDFNGNTKN